MLIGYADRGRHRARGQSDHPRSFRPWDVLTQNNSGLSPEPRNRPIPARLASTARTAEPRFAELQAAFVRRCGGLIGETTLRIMDQMVGRFTPTIREEDEY